MAKEKKQKQSPKIHKKGGYQPLKEGYQPSGHKKTLLKLPKGSSGESSNTSTTSSNNSTSSEKNKENDKN